MNAPHQTLVLCLCNDGQEASLEQFKVYTAIADSDARRHGMIRVIDESGEDYLFPARYFERIDLRRSTRETVLALLAHEPNAAAALAANVPSRGASTAKRRATVVARHRASA